MYTGAVLYVFVQDCQNGGEFACCHPMYLRLCFAFKNNNNYHPIILIIYLFLKIRLSSAHNLGIALSAAISPFALVPFDRFLFSLVAWWW